MAVTRRDYAADSVAAARSVLIELTRLLWEFRDHIAVIGGWVPELLLAREGVAHIGSTDIDLAVNHRTCPRRGTAQSKSCSWLGATSEGASLSFSIEPSPLEVTTSLCRWTSSRANTPARAPAIGPSRCRESEQERRGAAISRSMSQRK